MEILYNEATLSRAAGEPCLLDLCEWYEWNFLITVLSIYENFEIKKKIYFCEFLTNEAMLN